MYFNKKHIIFLIIALCFFNVFFNNHNIYSQEIEKDTIYSDSLKTNFILDETSHESTFLAELKYVCRDPYCCSTYLFLGHRLLRWFGSEIDTLDTSISEKCPSAHDIDRTQDLPVFYPAVATDSANRLFLYDCPSKFPVE